MTRRVVERRVADQLRAADPSHSVWLSANAGTAPDTILCLTFTKAAAAEMANRLYQRLGAWATMADGDLAEELHLLTGAARPAAGLGDARRLFARTLETPGGVKIQTIHAFCQSMLGRFPLEARIAPGFQAMDEREAAETLVAARDRVLIRAASGRAADLKAALDLIVGAVDEERFDKLMGEMTRDWRKFQRVFRAHDEDLDAVIERSYAALGVAPGMTDDGLIDEFYAAAPSADLQRAAKALAQGTKTDQERAALLRAWLRVPWKARRDALDEFHLPAFLTNTGEARARLITKTGEAAGAGVRDILEREQARVLALVEQRRALTVAAQTAALWCLGLAIATDYAAAKQAGNLLDFNDLILAARDLLHRDGVAAWVLYKLDNGLDHILVDEAQDTSPEQWQVIAALASEFFAGQGARLARRTVFAVGDEKQSIFSFQGADPAGFARMEDHFQTRVRDAEAAWRAMELGPSFRSAPTILEAVDRVFGPEAMRQSVTTRREIRHAPIRVGHAGLVEIWPLVGPEAVAAAEPWVPALRQEHLNAPSARLARRIAAVVSGWLQRGEILESRGRPIRPGDIMILVQRRNDFVAEMVRALKQEGVPVAGVDRMVLTDEIAVMDLLSLGRFVVLPDDDLALAEVLKGPLFGFSEDLLFDLAHARPGRLWPALQAARGRRPEFAAAHAELSRLLARADFAPPFEFFAELLVGGGRARILARLGPEAKDPLDEFLGLALAFGRAHAPSMQGFLAWLDRGGTEVKRDLEQGRDEVRVMTAHGAKGLEAPIVFLPDTCRMPDGHQDPTILWQAEADAPLPFWPASGGNDTAACAAWRAADRARRRDEYRRLLYVAMTRAEERLYIAGYHGRKAPAAESWYALTRAALEEVAEAVPLVFPNEPEAAGLRLHAPQAVPARHELAGAAAAAPPLPAWIGQPAAAEPLSRRPLAPSRLEGAELPGENPLRGDRGQRFRRGRLIHRLLQLLPDLPPPDRAPAAARFLARAEPEIAAAERAEIARQVFAVLDHPETRALFSPGSRAEAPVAGMRDGRPLFGQIDRLAVRDDEVLIADYKSERAPPDRADKVPPIYLAQMAAYRRALAAIYPGRRLRCFLIWTAGPDVMALPDALLDEAKAPDAP